MSGPMNEWTANLRFNVGSMGSSISEGSNQSIAWFGVTGLRVYQSCHITEIFLRTYQLVLAALWRVDFVI
jgi:hypothetical protein